MAGSTGRGLRKSYGVAVGMIHRVDLDIAGGELPVPVGAIGPGQVDAPPDDLRARLCPRAEKAHVFDQGTGIRI